MIKEIFVLSIINIVIITSISTMIVIFTITIILPSAAYYVWHFSLFHLHIFQSSSGTSERTPLLSPRQESAAASSASYSLSPPTNAQASTSSALSDASHIMSSASVVVPDSRRAGGRLLSLDTFRGYCYVCFWCCLEGTDFVYRMNEKMVSLKNQLIDYISQC